MRDIRDESVNMTKETTRLQQSNGQFSLHGWCIRNRVKQSSITSQFERDMQRKEGRRGGRGTNVSTFRINIERAFRETRGAGRTLIIHQPSSRVSFLLSSSVIFNQAKDDPPRAGIYSSRKEIRLGGY